MPTSHRCRVDPGGSYKLNLELQQKALHSRSLILLILSIANNSNKNVIYALSSYPTLNIQSNFQALLLQSIVSP